MAATAQAIVQVKAQGATQTNQEFQNLRKNITGNMTAAERSVASSLSSMAAQYISLGLVIRQVGKTLSQGVEFNKFIENQTMAFEVMMKSADKAKAKVQELYDFAVESPLTFKETVSSSKQLMAYGFAAEELVPTMKMLGTVSIATGHSLADIAYIYGTLKSQGRAYSRDLMQFGMRGIPIYEELAKVLKVDVTQIQKLASEGKIGFKEVEQAFASMTEESGRFGGFLEEYMETLTGKIAMLSDIWEQSTGKMAEGLSKVLGKAVDELTQKLESGELDGFIQGISDNVAGIASALWEIAKALIEIAPLLATIAKIWIGMKIGSEVVHLIGNLVNGLTNLSLAITSIPAKLAAVSTSITTLGVALKGVFTLIASSPVGLVLLGLTSAAVALNLVSKHLNQKKQDTINSSDEDQRRALLANEMSYVSSTMTKDLFGNQVYAYDSTDIDKLTESYKLQRIEVENLAMEMGLLQQINYKNLNFGDLRNMANSYGLAMEDALAIFLQSKRITDTQYQKAMEFLDAQKKIQEQYEEEARRMIPANQQMDFLAGLTGVADPKTFLDTSNKLGEKYTALGGKGAKMYIAGFEAERDKKKNLLGDLFTDKMMKDSLQKELDSLYDTLFAGMDLDAMVIEYDEAGKIIGATLKDGAFYEFSTFDEEILARIRELLKELEDAGGKTAKSLADPLVELSKWWLPEEARVKATLDAFDDMGLELRKQLATLDAETETRLDTIAKMGDEVDKAKLLHELAQDRAQAEKDIYKYMEQQADILQFQENLSGKTNYWTGIEAQAGTGDMGAVAMTSLQGSEVGSLMAGADPMTMLVKALADFAMSIENVGKVLNPLSTILEGARPLVELFLNSALQDMVNRLSALGVNIGKILAPILSLTQLFFLFSNVLHTMLLIPLELLGTGFAWINDHAIAPFGNMIIDLINTFIGWINKFTGASVPYIASIKKTTEANETYTKALKDSISNATNALTGTISFLLDKFNSYIDEQVDSYQDLYEVGAISGEEYARRVGSLDDRLDPGSVNISDKDKALEGQGAIAARLFQLYAVQNQLDSGTLSEEQQLALLQSVGMNTQSTTQLMMREAFEAAMNNVGVSTKATDIAEMAKLSTGVTSIPHNVNSSWDKVRDAAVSMWESIRTKAQSIWSSVQTTASGIWSSVKTSASGIWSSVQTTASGIWSSVKTSASGIWSSVQTTASGIWSSVKNAAAAPWKAVGNRIIQIFNGLIGGLNKIPGVQIAPLAYLAVGTPYVPYDMPAMIHQGEAVIPKTFMDGVRSGELSIGRNNGGGSNYYITVNVAGNVTAENDLAVSIAEVLYNERKTGRLAV